MKKFKIFYKFHEYRIDKKIRKLYNTYVMILERKEQNMETTDFSLELEVNDISTEQDYVTNGVTSTGCCKD